MQQNDVREEVTRYIRENFMYASSANGLDPDTPLLEQGVIDSMGVVEIIDFIESKFGVRVADEDITEENLGSVTAISRYVSGRIKQIPA